MYCNRRCRGGCGGLSLARAALVGAGEGDKAPQRNLLLECMDILQAPPPPVAAADLLHTGPLPRQRRGAIHFRYSEDSSFTMKQSGTVIQSGRRDSIASTAYRDMHSSEGDSWEVENCVGIALERLLKPLPGVTQVMVNVPNRTTTVDHDAQTTAGDLVLAL